MDLVDRRGSVEPWHTQKLLVTVTGRPTSCGLNGDSVRKKDRRMIEEQSRIWRSHTLPWNNHMGSGYLVQALKMESEPELKHV